MIITFERLNQTLTADYEHSNRCVCGKWIIPVVSLDEAVKAQEIGILEARIAQDTARLKQLTEQ